VHRIGRTGRAGAEGEAVSLVSAEERPLLAAIERLMNRQVEVRNVAGFEAGNVARAAPSRERRDERPQRNSRRDTRRPDRPTARPARPSEPRHARHEYRRPAAAPVNPEYQAQVEEARRRMRAEGEAPAPRPNNASRRSRQAPALFARKPDVPE
jgi:ATP-dependent RNA helicase RhlE